MKIVKFDPLNLIFIIMKKKFLFVLMVLALGVVNVAKADFMLLVRSNSPSLPITTSIEVDYTTTMEQVKDKLAEKWGVRANQIRLIYAGKLVADYETISSLNIQKDSMLHAVLRTLNSAPVSEEESLLDQVKSAWSRIFS